MPFQEKDGTLWFTATEFAGIHSITRQSVFDWIKQKRIPDDAIQKVSGKLVLIRQDALISAADFGAKRKGRTPHQSKK